MITELNGAAEMHSEPDSMNFLKDNSTPVLLLIPAWWCRRRNGILQKKTAALVAPTTKTAPKPVPIAITGVGIGF